MYDTSNMLVYFKYLGDPSAILHHFLFAFAAAYVLDQSIMAFPFIWLALGEISTPSVNLRYVNSNPQADLVRVFVLPFSSSRMFSELFTMAPSCAASSL